MSRKLPNAVGIGIAILVIVVSLVFLLNDPQNDQEAADLDTTPAADTDSESASEGPADASPSQDPVTEIVAVRKNLDETVWSDEVKAQKFEEPFIDLWDRMRSSDDQIADLAGFPFEDLTLGLPGEPGPHEHMVQSYQCDSGTRTFTPDEWKTWLNDWKEAGLKIIQTEWHHSKFEPDDEGPRSLVSFVLHAVNDSSNTWYSIRGKLAVAWKPLTSPTDMPQARSIETTEVNILTRQADPVFQEAAALEVSTPARLLLVTHDVDGDGLSEILSPSENRLYRNRGDFRFEPEPLFDAPPAAPSFAGVLADVTGDGRPDFLGSGANGQTFLYTADENGRFSTPSTIVHASEDVREPTVVTAGDIDGDGDLDLWIGQYRMPYRGGQMPTPYFDANDGYPAYLLRNDGNGRFDDITESAGLTAKRNRRTYSASFADIDSDNDLDLVVVSDYSGIDVYTNDGSGQFTDITDSGIDNRAAFGMSLTFSDYNSDGKLDFFMTGMSSTTALRLHAMGLGQEQFEEYQSNRPEMGYGNRMYLADGTNYHQAPFNKDVARTGWSWGSTSFDFDNDGDRDLFVANGHKSQKTAKDYCTSFWCHDIYTGTSTANPELNQFFQINNKMNFGVEGISWNGFEHNALMLNESGEQFLRFEFLAGVASELDSRNVISDDLNGDGRVDLLVLSRQPGIRERHISVLKNNNVTEGNWIGVRLDGAERSGLGARVTARASDRTHVAAVVAGDSYVSQHAQMVHFGLGESTAVEEIEITWPDGAQVKLTEPEINQYHRIQSSDIVDSPSNDGP